MTCAPFVSAIVSLFPVRRRPAVLRGRRERSSAQLAGGLIAVAPALGQRARHDLVEGPRHARRSGRARGRIIQVGKDRAGNGPAGERRLAGERSVEDAAERVNVRPGVRAVSLELLGCHEVDRPEPLAAVRHARVGGRVECQPEVAEVDVSRAILAPEEDVGGLDVTVHEADRVGCVEPGGDLRHDVRRVDVTEPARPANERLQIRATHPAHQEVEPSVLLTGAIHGNDVRMLDRRGHSGLPFEPRPEVRVGRPLGGDELQRDDAVEPELGGAIDDTHPAAPSHGFDAAAGESRVQGQIEHCRECDGAASLRLEAGPAARGSVAGPLAGSGRTADRRR